VFGDLEAAGGGVESLDGTALGAVVPSASAVMEVGEVSAQVVEVLLLGGDVSTPVG
jgi:hypothetical protein